MVEQSEIIDFLTGYAKSMKSKGHTKEIQSMGMKMIFDSVLEEVYKNG